LASRHFGDFDGAFTAPVNGFKDAEDYWKSSGCISKLNNIRIPTLLISATDDHFLNDDSFPSQIAEKHPFFHFHLSKYGGHVGFWGENKDGWLWSEECAWAFIGGNTYNSLTPNHPSNSGCAKTLYKSIFCDFNICNRFVEIATVT
jgi:predicted alpha/beta-fold hydrolase